MRDISNSKNHYRDECPEIQKRQESMAVVDAKGKVTTNRRRRRLFAIGEIFDSKD